MVSTLLSLTIIAISLSRSSQAIPQPVPRFLSFADVVDPGPPAAHSGLVHTTAASGMVTVAPQPTTPETPGEYYIVRPRLLGPSVAPQPETPGEYYVVRPRLPVSDQLAPSPAQGRRLAPSLPHHFTVGRDSSIYPPHSHGYFHMPTHAKVGSLEEHFRGRPALQAVALEQLLALTTRPEKPMTMSTDNLRLWQNKNNGYMALNPRDRAEICSWLGNQFFDSHLGGKHRARDIGYIWSLEQLNRRHPVWWKNSLISKGDPNNNGYIDLVDVGDLLNFFDPSGNFKLTAEQVNDIAPKLSDILYLGEDNNVRSVGLNIKPLRAYKDSAGVSMYESRTGQVMKELLRNFNRKTADEKKRVIQDLFLFTGTPPSEVIKRADNALNKNSESFQKLLEYQGDSRGQKDYQRIKAELEKLGKK
ncbi:hypothetical protein PtB15_13B267 [Puccinia triticina]|nr:hypothetical protein PtB15_13B267 [Puccinia triticina]